MTGEQRYGPARSKACPSCGGPKTAMAALCRTCRDAVVRREAKGRLPSVVFDAARGERNPAYGHTCPTCGGYKGNFHSRQCEECVGRGDALYTVGRREAIITFRNLLTGVLHTRHCVGRGVRAQVADGLRQLSGYGLGPWQVAARSTPESILTDLRRPRNARVKNRNFKT